MSDYDDYDNLFFEPIGDMSKLNDCNDGKRGSDVLVSAVDKCKDLEEKLRIAENYFQRILDVNTNRAIDSYQKCQMLAESALLKIKE